MRSLLLILPLIATCGSAARADSWRPPTVETTYSANGAYRFVSEPRDIQSRLAYFEAKAAGRGLPPADPARGRLERRTASGWEIVWTAPLANEVSPVTAVVSEDGQRVVTFDNWHSIGFGDNVVVIYGLDGKLVRSLRLNEVVPGYFVDALPRSVSSVSWQASDPRIDGETLKLSIKDVDDQIKSPALEVSLSLTDGRVAPITPAVLNAVRPRFCAGHIAAVNSHNRWTAFERADLEPLVERSQDLWPRYQYQVVQRLTKAEAPNARSIFENDPIEMLPAGEYMAKDFLVSFRIALREPDGETPVRWFSSRDLEAMTTEIERTAKKIKPNRLVGVEMHFLTDKVHWPQIEKALSATGAKLEMADISVPIPQRPERIAELPPDREVDPACVDLLR